MTMSPAAKPRLVIIGTGWAGFYVAQYIDQDLYDVTIISPRRTSAYTPLLASAAVGLFNFYLAEEPVRSKSRCGIRYLKASVAAIDFGTQRCTCTPAFEEDQALSATEFVVEYDHLIIAPGCSPNTFGTPGVAENALFMKNVSDAMALRKLLFDLLEKASLPDVSIERVRELLHIAIVGGGPTGIELTAELDDLSKNELRDLYPKIASEIRISIYDVAPNILSAFDKSLYEYANTQLLQRNIDIKTDTHILEVDDASIYLKESKSLETKKIPYGILVWATGNTNVPLVDTLTIRRSQKGLRRILTDTHLRVFKDSQNDNIFDNVYALGDAADIDGASLPTTAEVAVQKASYLVSVLNSSSQDRSDAAFKYKQKGLTSYIGGHDGVTGGIDGEHGWTGRRSWLAWRAGSIMWTRSWRSRLSILITWTMNVLFGKEIAKM